MSYQCPPQGARNVAAIHRRMEALERELQSLGDSEEEQNRAADIEQELDALYRDLSDPRVFDC